jgi:hypothetical protein
MPLDAASTAADSIERVGCTFSFYFAGLLIGSGAFPEISVKVPL